MPPAPRAARAFGISYRCVVEEDLGFLASVYASTRTEEVAVTGWPVDVQQRFLLQQFDAQHRHYRAHYPAAEWLVIERSATPIGRLYLEQWADQFRIIEIALLPAERGRGIGGAILADIMEDARRLGKAVSIHVEKNNRALSLYQKLGFVGRDEHGVYDLMEWRPSPASA